MDGYEQLHLQIPGEVECLLEDRSILKEQAQKVILKAETTGRKLINPATGRFLAFHRPKAVTSWVEYGQVGDEYRLVTTYSEACHC